MKKITKQSTSKTRTKLSMIEVIVGKFCCVVISTLLISAFIFVNGRATETGAPARFGKISGILVDADNGEPLIGANVILQGTSLGAASDLEGKYSITRVPPGNYVLVVRMMGYAKVTITDVRVLVGEITQVNASLKPEVVETEGVVVTAKALRNTEAVLLKERQRSISVSDAVSAEMISRSGSSNAADAMKQITGASVVDGKYIFVRGLGDRYISTQLNGAELPGANPYKRSGAIDLIPANLVDNIVTVKSFTPDKPGNFSGGMVNIQTRDFPEDFTMSFSTSTSYNTQTTFKNGYLSYEGGSLDWLGMDDGTRDIPAELTYGNTSIPNDIIAARKDSRIAYLLDRYTKAFSSQMVPSIRTAPLNQNYSFSVGNQFRLFKRPLGFLGSLTYKRNYSSYHDGRYMRWQLSGQDTTKTSLDNDFNFVDKRSTDEVLWGGLLKIAYKISSHHIVSLNGIFNQNGESSARFLEGSYPYDIDPDWLYQTNVLQYTERTLKMIQLNGEHQLMNMFGTRISWRTSLSNAKQNEPDLRYFYNYITDDHQVGIKSNLTPERYYRFMDENRKQADFDISIPFKQWSNKLSHIKFGGMVATKKRVFSERLFKYQPVNGIGQKFRQVGGDINRLFSDENMGLIDSTVAGNGNTYYDFGIYITEVDQRSSNYTGDQIIAATYAMLDINLARKLRFTGGVRFETTSMTVESENKDKPKGEIFTRDILPSANLIYSISNNMNLRLAYGKTLARPNFREISSFSSYDFKGGDTYIGNPHLTRTLIDNVDLRWEWFPNPGEIYAVSAFWKKFDNPIEQVIIDINYNIQWKNVDNAHVKGLEFEIRKRLDACCYWLRNFTLSGNLSLITSQVDIAPQELALIHNTRPDAPSTREFQGQSPYIINFNLTYENMKKGIVSSIYYNVFGRRLANVSLGGTPDVYELPAELLNFSFSKKLRHHVSINFSIKNLLDSKTTKVHEYKGRKYIYSEYGQGRSFALGLKYAL